MVQPGRGTSADRDPCWRRSGGCGRASATDPPTTTRGRGPLLRIIPSSAWACRWPPSPPRLCAPGPSGPLPASRRSTSLEVTGPSRAVPGQCWRRARCVERPLAAIPLPGAETSPGRFPSPLPRSAAHTLTKTRMASATSASSLSGNSGRKRYPRTTASTHNPDAVPPFRATVHDSKASSSGQTSQCSPWNRHPSLHTPQITPSCLGGCTKRKRQEDGEGANATGDSSGLVLATRFRRVHTTAVEPPRTSLTIPGPLIRDLGNSGPRTLKPGPLRRVAPVSLPAEAGGGADGAVTVRTPWTVVAARRLSPRQFKSFRSKPRREVGLLLRERPRWRTGQSAKLFPGQRPPSGHCSADAECVRRSQETFIRGGRHFSRERKRRESLPPDKPRPSPS